MSWPLVKLSEIFKIARGGSPRPISDYITENSDGLNWISIKDASNSDKYISKTKLKIRKEGLTKSRLVKPGDFLLTNSMSFGRPYIMNTTGCIHDGWLVLSSDKEKIDQEYFYYLLGSDLLHSKFSRLAAGAVVKNLNIDLVKSVEVPLPSLAEQKKIAAILDVADSLRQKDKQLIEHYRALSQSLFLEMFGDLSKNCLFDKEKASDVIDVRDGTHDSPKYVDNGFPLITSKNIKNGCLDLSNVNFISTDDYLNIQKRSGVSVGDIIMPMIGTIGNPHLVISSEKFAIKNVALYKFSKSSNIINIFMYYLLNSYYFDRYILSKNKGGTQKFLSLGDLRKMEVPIPPIKLQNKFSERIQYIEKQKHQAQVNLEKSEELFNSLLQRAFNGELTGSKVA